MPTPPAPCGLRTRHLPHRYGDNDADWCDGLPPPAHYDPRHRGRYVAELGWWPFLLILRKHRGCGDPDVADSSGYPRSRPRLFWRDWSTDDEGCD